MAGRSSGFLEDAFRLSALLPWWVGTALAAIAYAVLHWYAIADATSVSMQTPVVAAQTIKVIAGYAQYVIPLAFVAGAAASFLGRRKRVALITGVSGKNSESDVAKLSWQDFELMVGETFRMRGYRVVEAGGQGADGGVDLRLKQGSETFLVQCKHWRSTRVSVSVVRELFGVMAAEGATGGFVIASGRFTTDAERFARGRNIELIDGPALIEMIEDARMAGRTAGRKSGEEFRPIDANQRAQPSLASVSPDCPLCSSSMQRRVARRGQTVGTIFWGCSGYPKCRGTRPVA